MKLNRLLAIAAVVLFAQAAVYTQMGETIGPGNYRQIAGLRLSGVATVQLMPGDERQFRVLSTVNGRAGMFREVEAPTKWSVTKTEGIAINDKGNLTVSKGVRHGTKFNIMADVRIKESWQSEGYEQTIEQNVIVFDPKENPLVGDWTQNAESDCEGKKSKVEGRNRLRSLEFRADGTYSAAIDPFEVYRDYWGKYTFDAAKGTLKMTVDGGNVELIHLSTDGRYELKDGVLSIAGMRLLPTLDHPLPCKAHFTK